MPAAGFTPTAGGEAGVGEVIRLPEDEVESGRIS